VPLDIRIVVWWTYDDELLDAKLASDGTPKLWPDDMKPL